MRYSATVRYQPIVVTQIDLFGNPLAYEYGQVKVKEFPPYPSKDIAKKETKKWIRKNLKLQRLPDLKQRTRGPYLTEYQAVPEQSDFGKYLKVNNMLSDYRGEKNNRMQIFKNK
ncbi:hypothetical protein ESZ50_00775 [Weissella muntiaci]|uniref:Uncharacterized protein n=1 Tax=Weissella muntiaci TaxID=2508881 RepID=A0A6C2CAC3_9LACO|nr:hypothetical protein [Weissella muntiaci]TYC51101.1 hypothetical protein ESZ50_00775 [Weissella muntiaci]